MLLAIDTSTNWASLAVLEADRIVAQRHWAIGQRHGTDILGGIEELLHEAQITLSNIDALGVAIGPGSFNGLRVAVTVAKTLAFVNGLTIAGIPTLDGLAQASASQAAPTGRVLALLEAGRDELYMGWYDWKSEARRVERLGEISIVAATDLGASTERPALVVGEWSDGHRALLQAAWDHEVPWLAVPDRAVGVGQLAQRRLAQGQGTTAFALEPLYVRRPNITLSTRHPLPGRPEDVPDHL